MVLGVSGDDEDSHAAFKSKLGLPYSLLADDGNKVGCGLLSPTAIPDTHSANSVPLRIFTISSRATRTTPNSTNALDINMHSGQAPAGPAEGPPALGA